MQFLGLELKTPVFNASGTVSPQSADAIDLSLYGGLVTKTVKLDGRKGNLGRRVCETPSGMLNAIGLEGPGIDQFLAEEWPQWLSFGVPVGINIAGSNVEEYARLAAMVDKTEAAFIEANLSCPNVANGMAFSTDEVITFEVIAAIIRATSKPVIAKLTPNVTDITRPAKAAQSAGASALSLINTVLGMRFDLKTGKPVLGNKTGGLSGPAILPIALRCVWQVAQAVDIPVIGMGGITCANDAREFFYAGAKAVALGTINLVKPEAVSQVIAGISESNVS
jgi:dihydroorotate dehydrogenase (NAD+) catalytic subunit